MFHLNFWLDFDTHFPPTGSGADAAEWVQSKNQLGFLFSLKFRFLFLHLKTAQLDGVTVVPWSATYTYIHTQTFKHAESFTQSD